MADEPLLLSTDPSESTNQNPDKIKELQAWVIDLAASSRADDRRQYQFCRRSGMIARWRRGAPTLDLLRDVRRLNLARQRLRVSRLLRRVTN